MVADRAIGDGEPGRGADHQADADMVVLTCREEKECRIDLGEAGMPHVLGDPNDFDRLLVSHAQKDALPDRVLIDKQAARCGLVYDRYTGGISPLEPTSQHDWN